MLRSRLHSVRWLPLLLAGLSFVAVGCGSSSTAPSYKLVPVQGMVTINGKPAPPEMAIHFHPDAAKQNTIAPVPSSNFKTDGSYNLNTDGKMGAPVGWYKVTFDYTENPPPFKPKYKDVKTTDLTIEVVESPEAGRYDFKLTK